MAAGFGCGFRIWHFARGISSGVSTCLDSRIGFRCANFAYGEGRWVFRQKLSRTGVSPFAHFMSQFRADQRFCIIRLAAHQFPNYLEISRFYKRPYRSESKPAIVFPCPTPLETISDSIRTLFRTQLLLYCDRFNITILIWTE